MKLSPPIEQYLSGSKPSHSSRNNIGQILHKRGKVFSPTQSTSEINKIIDALLLKNNFVSDQNKPTQKALQMGIIDSCDGKVLWNISKLESFIQQLPQQQKTSSPQNTFSGEPKWVDLDTIGTYFGVSKIVVGRWLDQLGYRAKPELSVNSSGAHDMLDVARQKQQEQAAGFIGKEITEKALSSGAARKLTVTNRKQQEVEITQWNLDVTKSILVKAGHRLDTEKKMMLKGKGKNSNVKVNGIDARAQELYNQWAALYRDPSTRWKINGLFAGQPTAILKKVEEHMQMPGYITEKRYLQDK